MLQLRTLLDRAVSLPLPMPPALRGALWMAAGALALALMMLLVRLASRTQHTFEIVFFRNLFGLIAILPVLLRNRRAVLFPNRPGLLLVRSAMGFVAMCLWFSALALVPLAEATALSFTAPIFTILLAVVFLGETMRARRWVVTAVAFIGALLILRPGFRELGPEVLLALAAAVVWGASSIVVKVLGRSEPSEVIVTWMVAPLVPVSLLMALPVWRTPDAFELTLFALMGLAGSIGHFCVSRALATTEAGIVAPYDYLRLPFVAWLGWMVLDERVDLWTWVGGGLIAAGGIVLARREARAGGG
jgi:drug/metabolite transporter (DMT)-like permease